MSYEHDPAGNEIETKGSLAITMDESDHMAVEVYPNMPFIIIIIIPGDFLIVCNDVKYNSNPVGAENMWELRGQLLEPAQIYGQSVENLIITLIKKVSNAPSLAQSINLL